MMLCLWGRTAVKHLRQRRENTWDLSFCFSAWNTFFESTKQLLQQASSSANNIIAQLHIVYQQVLVKHLFLCFFVSFSTLCGILIFYLVQTACSIGEEVNIISAVTAVKHCALYYSICCTLHFFDTLNGFQTINILCILLSLFVPLNWSHFEIKIEPSGRRHAPGWHTAALTRRRLALASACLLTSFSDLQPAGTYLLWRVTFYSKEVSALTCLSAARFQVQRSRR